ncbi:hypothetical protein LTR50_002182 [Elasticomyces elasticus]|nr:hypothetical protein LTR50_002182 [Elasticomyces elasticus]
MLKHAKSSPDISNYLVYLCANSSPPPGLDASDYHAARTAAAIMLKNSIKSSYKNIPETNKSHIRSTIVLGLQDPNPQIRNYAGNVITEIVRQGGILGWPQILSELSSLVGSVGGNVSAESQDGAMGALLKICEDNKRALDKSYQGQRPIEFLLPELLSFTSNANAKVRTKALASILVFLKDPVPQAVRTNVDRIFARLLELATDTNDEVRILVCKTFTAIAKAFPEKIMPHIGGIVDYILSQQRDTRCAELAIAAGDFFFDTCDIDEIRRQYGPYISKIVPVLLEGMIYSEDDQARLEQEAEDAEEEDREQDIKPQFATVKGSRLASAEPASPANGTAVPGKNGYAYEDDDLSEGEIDEDDEYGDDPEDQWNLRKCSAATLDALASEYHEAVFDATLPYLKENLTHQDWPRREAAVLALGAVAEGCMEFVYPHLPDLTRYLLTLLDDSTPVVRQITCWALGRYSAWASHLDKAGKQQYFEPIMDGLLQHMLDKNKKVQQAAASAFVVLEEKANNQLTPYCSVIVQQFGRCFASYQDRNIYMLYDCVQTLAEHVGPELARPELVEILMPALIGRWQRVVDQSREMFPLLECLAYIATALGRAFAPFAKPFFARCISLIQHNLEDGLTASSNFNFDVPDKDFLVTSLDLLSAIIQALDEARSMDLVATAQPNFFTLLAYCMKDPNNDVRQSAYALLGDCAICVFPQLQTCLAAVLEIAIAQLDLNEVLAEEETTAFRVINNACWACGEIAMRQGAGMGPFVDKLLQKLATILFSDKVPESLNENAAIALGRLGLGSSDQLAPHLATFAPPFLQSLRKVDWTDEKGHALKGFVKIVLDNPEAMEQCLHEFFGDIASAPTTFLTSLQNDGPYEEFQKVLMLYKGIIPDFNGFLHRLSPAQEQALRQIYSL